MEIIERERRAEVVVTSYEGIIPYCEAFYITSIIYSAGRCLEAFQKYEQNKNQNIDPEYLVSTIQEAVGHAAALSRYFWPSPNGRKSEPNHRKLKENRGRKLCKAFCVNDDSPLYNRDLRNAWEHFDERLDTYLLENESGSFFPACIVGSHTLADEPIGHIFKLLDHEAECLVLLGIKHFFSPIQDEVKRIYSKALEADAAGARI